MTPKDFKFGFGIDYREYERHELMERLRSKPFLTRDLYTQTMTALYGGVNAQLAEFAWVQRGADDADEEAAESIPDAPETAGQQCGRKHASVQELVQMYPRLCQASDDDYDRMLRGIWEDEIAYVSVPYECQVNGHTWVSVGFTSSTRVCKVCDCEEDPDETDV